MPNSSAIVHGPNSRSLDREDELRQQRLPAPASGRSSGRPPRPSVKPLDSVAMGCHAARAIIDESGGRDAVIRLAGLRGADDAAKGLDEDGGVLAGGRR